MPPQRPLDLEVYLQPPPPEALRGAAVVVLDIFRATTVHAALFAGGAGAVHPVADFGNSPTEFAALDVRDWTVVHVTSNGTRALAGASMAELTLSGCLRNRAASLQYVLNEPNELNELSERETAQRRVAIVCSGDHGGSAPSVEDSFAAGAYVAGVKRLRPDIALRGGARLALRLYQSYARAPSRAFADSPHGDHLRRLGFEADFAYAGALDVDSTVIRLAEDGSGRPVLERVPALPH